MDPDAALKEIREEIYAYRLDCSGWQNEDRLIELVEGLDEWLSKGGFPPAAWSAHS